MYHNVSQANTSSHLLCVLFLPAVHLLWALTFSAAFPQAAPPAFRSSDDILYMLYTTCPPTAFSSSLSWLLTDASLSSFLRLLYHCSCPPPLLDEDFRVSFPYAKTLTLGAFCCLVLILVSLCLFLCSPCSALSPAWGNPATVLTWRVPSLTLHLLLSKPLLFSIPVRFLVTNHKNPLWLTETEKEFRERLLRALRVTGKANEIGLVNMEAQGGSWAARTTAKIPWPQSWFGGTLLPPLLDSEQCSWPHWYWMPDSASGTFATRTDSPLALLLCTTSSWSYLGRNIWPSHGPSTSCRGNTERSISLVRWALPAVTTHTVGNHSVSRQEQKKKTKQKATWPIPNSGQLFY